MPNPMWAASWSLATDGAEKVLRQKMRHLNLNADFPNMESMKFADLEYVFQKVKLDEDDGGEGVKAKVQEISDTRNALCYDNNNMCVETYNSIKDKLLTAFEDLVIPTFTDRKARKAFVEELESIADNLSIAENKIEVRLKSEECEFRITYCT